MRYDVQYYRKDAIYSSDQSGINNSQLKMKGITFEEKGWKFRKAS